MPIPALGAVPSQSGRTASTKNAEVTWEGRQVELKQLSFHAWCHPLRRLSGICVCQVARVLAQSSECLRWNAALAGELRMGRSRGLRFQKPPIWYPQIIFFYTRGRSCFFLFWSWFWLHVLDGEGDISAISFPYHCWDCIEVSNWKALYVLGMDLAQLFKAGWKKW